MEALMPKVRPKPEAAAEAIAQLIAKTTPAPEHVFTEAWLRARSGLTWAPRLATAEEHDADRLQWVRFTTTLTDALASLAHRRLVSVPGVGYRLLGRAESRSYILDKTMRLVRLKLGRAGAHLRSIADAPGMSPSEEARFNDALDAIGRLRGLATWGGERNDDNDDVEEE